MISSRFRFYSMAKPHRIPFNLFEMHIEWNKIMKKLVKNDLSLNLKKKIRRNYVF